MTQQKFQIDRELYPFTSHFMTMEDGAQLHYIDEGSGEQTFVRLPNNLYQSSLQFEAYPLFPGPKRGYANFPEFGQI